MTGVCALVVLGIGGALWVICGGPWSNLGLVLCWVCYLSLHPAVGLAYPWECLLLAGRLPRSVSPRAKALPDFSASTLPLPAVAWAYRWLLFRMVLGFGKIKFEGVNRKELGYLKAFFIAVPLPSPLGWYGHHLPGWFMKFSLIGLFFIEVVTPFLIFVPGYPRLVAAGAIASLMVAIQLTGNYGHFNVLTLVLCVPLLDYQSSLLDQPLDGIMWPLGNLLIHTVVLILFVGGLLYFHSSSWCTLAWIYWPSQWKRRPALMRWLVGFYRQLAPFRILHAYGVFPSISFPAARAVPVIEGTQDGKVWKEYPYRWLMRDGSSPPVWVAPHTPRLDHFLFYDASGTDVSDFLGSTFSLANPYLFSHWSGLERLVHAVEGSPGVLSLFRSNPFPTVLAAIRVSLYMLQPTQPGGTESHRRRWRRSYLGPHLLPATRDDTIWQEWLSDPERFHPDELIWKLRAPRLRALFDCAA